MKTRTIIASLCAGIVLLLAGTALAHAEGLIGCEHHVRYDAPSQEPTLLCRLGYALSHDSSHKVPDWVAYQLVEENMGGNHPRSEDYRADVELPPGCACDAY